MYANREIHADILEGAEYHKVINSMGIVNIEDLRSFMKFGIQKNYFPVCEWNWKAYSSRKLSDIFKQSENDDGKLFKEALI